MGMASHLSVLRLERACAWEVGQSVASTRFRRFSELFTVTKLLFSSKTLYVLRRRKQQRCRVVGSSHLPFLFIS